MIQDFRGEWAPIPEAYLECEDNQKFIACCASSGADPGFLVEGDADPLAGGGDTNIRFCQSFQKNKNQGNFGL